jgi:predicted nucleic acid-binding protein
VRKLYLDTSVLNRPFDDQGQVRIKLETEAFLAILERVEKGTWELVSSSVLEYENDANPFSERKQRVQSYLGLARHFADVGSEAKKRAGEIEKFGIKAIDALHLAAAESSADVFLSVDDHLLKRARDYSEKLRVKVINPIDFVLWEEFLNA